MGTPRGPNPILLTYYDSYRQYDAQPNFSFDHVIFTITLKNKK